MKPLIIVTLLVIFIVGAYIIGQEATKNTCAKKQQEDSLKIAILKDSIRHFHKQIDTLKSISHLHSNMPHLKRGAKTPHFR